MYPHLLSEKSREFYESIYQRYPQRSLTETEQLVQRVIAFDHNYVYSDRRHVLERGNETKSKLQYEIARLNKPLIEALCRTALYPGEHADAAKQQLTRLYPYAGYYFQIFSDQYPSDLQAMLDGVDEEDFSFCQRFLMELVELVGSIYIPPEGVEEALIWTGYGPILPLIVKEQRLTGSELLKGMTLPPNDQATVSYFMRRHYIRPRHLDIMSKYTINTSVEVITLMDLKAFKVTHPNGHSYVMYPNVVL